MGGGENGIYMSLPPRSIIMGFLGEEKEKTVVYHRPTRLLCQLIKANFNVCKQRYSQIPIEAVKKSVILLAGTGEI